MRDHSGAKAQCEPAASLYQEGDEPHGSLHSGPNHWWGRGAGIWASIRKVEGRKEEREGERKKEIQETRKRNSVTELGMNGKGINACPVVLPSTEAPKRWPATYF